MTFQEFQQQRGKNQSSEQDYQQYMEFLKQAGPKLSKAVAKKQMKKPSPRQVSKPVQAPTSISGMDMVGQGVQMGGALSNFTNSGTAKRFNLNATPDLAPVADFDKFGKQFDAPDAAPMTPPPGADAAGTTFTGDAAGVAAAGAMAMQTAQSQTAQQAIMGGAMTGLSVGSMLAGSAAGPVGVAAGLGTALVGLSNASSSRRKREMAESRAKEEAERLRKRSEQLKAKSEYNTRRQRAYESLMGAFR